MEKEAILKLNKSFKESAYAQDGVDYCLARELQMLLGYTDWRNFLNSVDKAKESCQNIGEAVSDQFVDVKNMIPLPKGSEKQIEKVIRNSVGMYWRIKGIAGVAVQEIKELEMGDEFNTEKE